jgi:hypothetical protein
MPNLAYARKGIDDRSILAIVIGAIKDLWSKVLALIASDEAQNARIKQLEDEVAALKAAAGTSENTRSEAPDGSPATPDADIASTAPSAESSHVPADEKVPTSRQMKVPPALL